MRPIARVLCPTDFSEFSRTALDHAAAVARWQGASLAVLHVHLSLPVMDVPPPPMTAAEREAGMTALRQFTAHVGLPVDLRLEEWSDVRRAILAAAEQADLLVMGSHGRSGFNRFLLGSVTERVIRQAPCPTLVVPKRAPGVTRSETALFSRILCPIDFSEVSTEALNTAAWFAGQADAGLIVLHVIEVPPGLREARVAVALDDEYWRNEVEPERRRKLEELLAAQSISRAAIETAVSGTPPHREILRVAEERQCDLIVLGVRGRGAVDRLMFGSNTARVARSATCPVLVVPQA